MTSRFLLGIDTGGTYTDAVLFSDNRRGRRGAGQGADHAARSGRRAFRGAVENVLADDRAPTLRAIRLVSLSTTLATNALVEGQGGRAGLVMIGFGPEDLEARRPAGRRSAAIRWSSCRAGTMSMAARRRST